MFQGESMPATLRTEVMNVFMLSSCIRNLSAEGQFQSPCLSFVNHVSMVYLVPPFGIPLKNYPKYGSLICAQ